MGVEGRGRNWAQTFPELDASVVPIEPCVSPEYFEMERENLFKRVWLNVGRVEEIPNPGDYFVRDLSATANATVIVIRGKDKKIRAFHNVCPHRGNQIVWDDRGSCNLMRCRYHAWAFNTEGQLVAVPDEDQFLNFRKEDHGLPPIAADVCGGFIFINVNPQPRETLKEFLGEVADRLESYPTDQLTEVYGYTAEIKANWKVILDAFQEIYHVGFLHGKMFPAYYSEENPYGHLPFIQLGRYHRMFTSQASREAPTHPTLSVVAKYAPTFSNFMAGDEEYKLPEHFNPGKVPNWSFDLNLIFPNFTLAAMDGFCFSYHFWPLAADRTRFEVRQYYKPLKGTAAQRVSREYSKILQREPLLEDFGACEHIQKALATRAIKHFTLQDNEIIIKHFYKTVEEFTGYYRKHPERVGS